MNYQVLQVRDEGNYYGVYGTTYVDSLTVDTTGMTLKASFSAIELVKLALSEGKQVKVPKQTRLEEVQDTELLFGELDTLDAFKASAKASLERQMNRSLLSMSIIDGLNYFDSAFNLFDAGIVITDSNKEQQYLNIIMASQLEEPTELSETATAEEEQQYIKQKQEYDIAQRNLANLEVYLNAYDALSSIRYTKETVNTTIESINRATTEEEIDTAMELFTTKIKQPQESYSDSFAKAKEDLITDTEND